MKLRMTSRVTQMPRLDAGLAPPWRRGRRKGTRTMAAASCWARRATSRAAMGGCAVWTSGRFPIAMATSVEGTAGGCRGRVRQVSSTSPIHPGIHPWVDASRGPDPETGAMTFSDYLIDITLISIVLIQMRGRKLTLHSLLLPVGIVGYVAVTYLNAIPTNGNNLFLIVGCAAVGATLGGLAAHFTAVRVNGEGIPVAKAGLLAAGLWILGTGGRLAFQLYASHGGAASIEHFSAAHAI